MDADEVAHLLERAERQLVRVRQSFEAALHPDERVASANREELRSGLSGLKEEVGRLARAVSGIRIDVSGQPRCDRCGGPTSVYGDCLGGSHITEPMAHAVR